MTCFNILAIDNNVKIEFSLRYGYPYSKQNESISSNRKKISSIKATMKRGDPFINL